MTRGPPAGSGDLSPASGQPQLELLSQDGFTVPVVEKIETSNLLPKFPRSCSLQDNTIAHSKISSPFPGQWGASTPVVMITLLFAILLLTSLFIMDPTIDDQNARLNDVRFIEIPSSFGMSAVFSLVAEVTSM